MLVTNDRRGSSSWWGGYRFLAFKKKINDVIKANIVKIKIPKFSMMSSASYVLMLLPPFGFAPYLFAYIEIIINMSSSAKLDKSDI
jgi:hypothetical protein